MKTEVYDLCIRIYLWKAIQLNLSLPGGHLSIQDFYVKFGDHHSLDLCIQGNSQLRTSPKMSLIEMFLICGAF
jgi:hypothetical protein